MVISYGAGMCQTSDFQDCGRQFAPRSAYIEQDTNVTHALFQCQVSQSLASGPFVLIFNLVAQAEFFIFTAFLWHIYLLL